MGLLDFGLQLGLEQLELLHLPLDFLPLLQPLCYRVLFLYLQPPLPFLSFEGEFPYGLLFQKFRLLDVTFLRFYILSSIFPNQVIVLS